MEKTNSMIALIPAYKPGEALTELAGSRYTVYER